MRVLSLEDSLNIDKLRLFGGTYRRGSGMDSHAIHYLDIGAKFKAEDGTLPKDILPDALHLRPAGYEIWAEAMEPTLARLMGDDPVR